MNHDEQDVGGQVVSEIGPWAMVPVWVLTKGLKPAELVTYIALRSFADRGGDAHPYTATIAKRANLAVGTVRNAIQALRDKGLLVTTERYRVDGSLAGLDFKLFDIDPNPGTEIQPRRTGEKGGPKPGVKAGKKGASTDVPPSTGAEKATNRGGPTSVDVGGPTPTDVDASINWCTQEEHTIEHTNLEHQNPAAGAAGEAGKPMSEAAQTTIDGTEESLAPRDATLTDLANEDARIWAEFWKNKGTPIAGAQVHAKLRSLILSFLKAEYTATEIREAFKRIAAPVVPTADRLQRELAAVRGVDVAPTSGAPRGAGARVNDQWNRADDKPSREPAFAHTGGNTVPTQSAPRADAIQTTGGFW